MGSNEPIPIEVLDAIEEVRDSGQTNMMSRVTVIHLISEAGHFRAFNWLVGGNPDNPDDPIRYLAALTAMGERRAQRKGVTK